MHQVRKTMLIIMDGWGINKNAHISAIEAAQTPFIDSLYKTCRNTTLLTHGEHVGLPNDQMGNSEVGHMNIGAGRVIYQDLLKINKSIESGLFFNNETLIETLAFAKAAKKDVHFIGLVSDGGIHSHINHLKALVTMAKEAGVDASYVWTFTDGRDTDPNSGKAFLEDLQLHCSEHSSKIAGVIGRYYAMDRDKRWERVKLAYDLLVHGKGLPTENIIQTIEDKYQEGETDEFIKPVIHVDKDGKPLTTIKEGDVVICFNFRTDRCREITEVLTQKEQAAFDMKPLSLYYVTMTSYDEQFRNIKVVFSKDNLNMTLGEVIAKNGLSQLRIAETEKYPHVTFFFSGGREQPFVNEDRVMISSPKVATYDLQPEMSANGVKDAVIGKIVTTQPDFICLNFANTDMVGHTGVFSAAVKAAETVDACVKSVVEQALAYNYTVLVTADHGNADVMINADGSPNTAHSKNAVPLFLIEKEKLFNLKTGKLADLAPTILTIMGLEVPVEMSGNVLVESVYEAIE